MKKITITQLRESLQGRVYVYFDSEEVCREFMVQAEMEGFTFEDTKPTEISTDIVALDYDKKLHFLGFVGHMAFGSPEGVIGEFYRIDYRRVISGEEDYSYRGRKYEKKQKIAWGF